MTASEFVDDLTRRGFRLKAEGNRLRYHPRAAMTPELLEALRTHKAEILSILRGDPKPVPTKPRFDPAHPLATFDWDSSNGSFPGRRIIRQGIEHKRDDCPGRSGWQHVWGAWYCRDCWPCTDPLAKVSSTMESKQ